MRPAILLPVISIFWSSHRRVLNFFVLPVLTCHPKKLTPAKHNVKNIRKVKKKGKIYSGINFEISYNKHCKNIEMKLAVHVARMKENRWTKRVVEWKPREDRKRNIWYHCWGIFERNCNPPFRNGNH